MQACAKLPAACKKNIELQSRKVAVRVYHSDQSKNLRDTYKKLVDSFMFQLDLCYYDAVWSVK